MRKRFQKMLLSNKHLDLSEQRNALDRELNDWQGDVKQLDDILVVGIELE